MIELKRLRLRLVRLSITIDFTKLTVDCTSNAAITSSPVMGPAFDTTTEDRAGGGYQDSEERYELQGSNKNGVKLV